MKVRRIDIDILRVIGLLCIILAHVNPPKKIFILRNFDVVLMIIISSYLGIISFKKIGYLQYIKKRFKRLVVPTWIFLVIFFIIAYIFNLCIINKKILFDSFSLMSGIGYVWVIRIYFIISILIPICKKLIDTKSTKFIVLSTIILYFIYEILYYYGIFNNITIENLLAYIIPCYTLIILSYYIFKINNKKKVLITFISFIIFISLTIYFYRTTNTLMNIQEYKYPFRIYYLSYGVFVSSFLILCLTNDKLCNILNNKIISFLSYNSLWIYLWHILIIYILKKYTFTWYINYIILIIIPSLIVILQNKTKKYLKIIIPI